MIKAYPFVAVLLLAGVCHAQLNFLVMGDWGGSPDSPYTTGAEVAVAKAMDVAAKDSGALFSLGLGDNFYNEGVTSINDPRFLNTFESVFTGGHLKAPFQFHFIAGNHDHNGNVTAEIDYSNVDSRWSFPSEYYTFTKTAPDGATVQFVMIDTVILAGNSDVGDVTLDGDALPGPADQAVADSQLQWIEETLAASTADYLIVAGHYPVYSICEHGPTALLELSVKPLLEKYNVNAYFNGHDHCAELIEVDGVQYHTIGAAHGVDSSTEHKDDIPSGSLKFHWAGSSDSSSSDVGAFASVSVTKANTTITRISGTGEVLFVNSMKPRSS